MKRECHNCISYLSAGWCGEIDETRQPTDTCDGHVFGKDADQIVWLREQVAELRCDREAMKTMIHRLTATLSIDPGRQERVDLTARVLFAAVKTHGYKDEIRKVSDECYRAAAILEEARAAFIRGKEQTDAD